MKNWQFFLTRCLESIERQAFKDYEVILAKVGSMPVTSNRVIQDARGEFIKVLYVDDYLSHPNSLVDALNFFQASDSMGYNNTNWLIQGTNDNLNPKWTDDIETGNNKLGSPSSLFMRNDDPLLFDENLSWLLDVDLYKRMKKRWGTPHIMPGNHITIGKHDGQMTNLMSADYKLSEHEYVRKKYE